MDERGERFRSLFNATYGPLHAYARRRCDREDADDLVAEVFSVAWRRLDDVPLLTPLPWLYGVARRVLLNQRRSLHRRARLIQRLAREGPRPGPDPSIEPVLAALARLSAGDQEILRLSAWEQLRPPEIAAVFGVSVNAATLRLSRARARLRRELTEQGVSRTGTARKDDDGTG